MPEDAKAGAKSGESGAVNAGNTKETAVSSAVSSYETLVSMIDVLFQAHGDSLTAEEIGDAVKECVSYYRKNLAEERKSEDGQVSYVLKDSVKEALGEDGTKALEESTALMEKYQVRYVELLIRELDPENPGDFSQDVKEARAQYEALTTAAKAEVANESRLTEMEEWAGSRDGDRNTDRNGSVRTCGGIGD